MEQYGTRLLRMSALYLRDADLAQDAVQETFIRAYRHGEDYRGDSRESTWLTAICINVCRDMIRSAWFRHNSRISVASLPEKVGDFAFPDDTVLRAVMALNAKHREIVLMRYYQQMRIGEIAEALHLSEGKVRYRLKAANTILRSQ